MTLENRIARINKRVNCRLGKSGGDPRIKPLWVRKGYAKTAVEIQTEDIYLGNNLVTTLSSSLVNSEVGTNTGSEIQLMASDWSVRVPRIHSYDWFRENILYYAFQETYTETLDEYGNIPGKRCSIILIEDKKPNYLTLILRQHQEEKLKANESITGQFWHS